MSERILEALATLDPADDTHWTKDDLPNVLVLRELLGDDSLTRRQVEAVAPGFSRETVQATASEAEAAPPPPEPEVVQTREQAEAEAKEKISALQAAKKEHLEAAKRAKQYADDVDKEIDAVRNELAERFPPLTQAQRHKEWAKRNLEERRKRVENERAALAVLNQTHKSPLDQAFAARRVKRPEYPAMASPAKKG